MRRHVIVEGMDGSGKDYLISKLLKGPASHFQVHERASTSMGGPVANLSEWVANDVKDMGGMAPQLYNRHPLISERIYRHYRKPLQVAHDPDPMFEDSPWLSAMSREVSKHAVVVVCQPPYHVVEATLRNQGPAAQMPGVFENRLSLYIDYSLLVWPGAFIRYDYTRSTPEALWTTIESSFEWSRDH